MLTCILTVFNNFWQFEAFVDEFALNAVDYLLQFQITMLLKSLPVDQSIIQQVKQHTEDVVFGRNSYYIDEASREEENSNSSNSTVVLLTGKEFEQKWFPWAL